MILKKKPLFYLLILVISFMILGGRGFAQDGALKGIGSVGVNLSNSSLSKVFRPIYYGERYIYKITWQDKLAGYSKFKVESKLSLAGKTFYKIQSNSELKIGMGGIDHLYFSGNMTVRAKDLKPTFFACRQKQGNSSLGVDCLISENLIAQKNISPLGSKEHIVSFPDKKVPFIYMNNLWGRADTLVDHVWLLIHSGKTGKIFVYDPVLQYKGNMELTRGKISYVDINSKKIRARLYKLKDFSGSLLMNIWVDHRGTILKMQEPGGGITFEITTNEKIVKYLKDSPGVDIWQDRVSQVEMYLSNPKNIKMMKVQLKLKGKNINPLDPKVKGLMQKFSGTNEDGNLEGEFIVNSKKFKVTNSIKFPVSKNDIPENLKGYLKPEVGIESDFDYIHNKALEITWKSKNSIEAAKKICDWVGNNIPQGIALPSAKMTLTNGQGNSESKSLLGIALCRAVDIPARKAGGIVFYDGSFIPHYWFEVYAQNGLWIPMDPSLKETDALDATHIRLFSQGEIWNLDVKVLDYSPRPPARVSYINRELTWPVGEERVYAVKKNGKKIGEEISKVTEMMVMGEQEVYHMVLTNILKISGQEIAFKGDYWMNPKGLPVKYQKELTQGSMKESHIFTLKGRVFHQEAKTNRGEIKRKIPVSKGVYMADSHFLTQWALIAGQFPKPTIGSTYLFTVFIPEALATEKVQVQVKTIESVEAGDKIYDAYRIEAGKGIVFWMDTKSKKIVKISFKREKVDLELIAVRFKL